jgi:hypothetical protein
MEDIFKFHQPNIPFLRFPEIRSLIVSCVKIYVSKQTKIESFQTKITGLESSDAFNFLPKHLQLQFNKLVKADLNPDILRVGHDFLFKKEISDLNSRVSVLKNEIVELEKDFNAKLDKYLTFAKFQPRPSNTDEWDAFCALYYMHFVDDLKAHFLMSFDKFQSIHTKRKQLKQQKFEEFKAKRSQPLIVTEELLEQKFKELSISKNSKKVKFSLPKTGKRSSGKDRAPAKSRQGSHRRAASRSPTPRPRSRSKSPKRSSQGNKGKRSSRKRRS